jgi:hypothetical protein
VPLAKRASKMRMLSFMRKASDAAGLWFQPASQMGIARGLNPF